MSSKGSAVCMIDTTLSLTSLYFSSFLILALANKATVIECMDDFGVVDVVRMGVSRALFLRF